jgi:hypothetical protein
MNRLLTLFGQILRKNDVDFQQQSNRDSIVKTHIDFTDQLGGIVDGLEVLPSSDGKSILITPGVFYSKGVYNDKNNIGGGERGQVFVTESVTGLPRTEPISNEPSFLLVYAKVINSNVNPDPTKSQTVSTSKNILTGQNLPIRSYAQGTIVVSNPILRSEVSKFNGIPLALLTVDFDEDGFEQTFNGSIQNIIVDGIRKPYLLGGTIDILNNTIDPDGIADGLIINRMIANGTIDGTKLTDASVGSQIIAPWDGTTAADDLTGDGIATDHLKDGVVTRPKISYTGSMAAFNTRNRLQNSSFEISFTGNVNLPATWAIDAEGTSEIRIGIDQADSFPVKYGQKSLRLDGGSFDNGSFVEAYDLKVSQIIDFEEDLTGKPITPFFWAQISQISDFAISGTTGLQGKVELLDRLNNVVQTTTYATVSGASTGWIQYAAEEPIVYSGTGAPTQVNFIVGGAFGGSYYVDGAFLGMTDIVPEFDIKPSEFVTIDEFAGLITTNKIENGAINTRKILRADGTVSTDLGAGIITGHIRDNVITTNKIVDGAITTSKLAPDAGLVPKGAIILWDSGTTCPSGYIRVGEMDGRFPLGVNSALGSNISTVGIQGGTATIGDAGNTGWIQYTNNGTVEHVHAHVIAGVTIIYDNNDDQRTSVIKAFGGTNNDAGHRHNVMMPYYTVVFCRKLD